MRLLPVDHPFVNFNTGVAFWVDGFALTLTLELLMTRQNERDRTVISNAEGLDFLVLDELHTYRGRQGADVAMLVRRVRDRLCRDKTPICIGTSATMASEGGEESRAIAVANVASRLFGTPISPDAVIDESLERATDPAFSASTLGTSLAAAVDAEIPANLDDNALRSHPLAVWIELEIGLLDGQRLTRRPPVTIAEAADRLAERTGRDVGHCRRQLQSMLTLMSQSGERARWFRRSCLPGFQVASIHRRRWTSLRHAKRAGASPRDARRTTLRSDRRRGAALSHVLLSQLRPGTPPCCSRRR